MNDAQLRPATPADALTLTAIMNASSAYQGSYASILDGCTVTPAYLESHPTVVAEDDRSVLGFYSLITDHAQGRGIGRWLIGHLLDYATRLGLPAIRVVSHPPAEGFYRALGARRVGTVAPRPPATTWSRPDLVFHVPMPE